MPATITPKNAAHLDSIGSARFGWIGALAWSPDGRRIAVGGGDGVAIWMDTFGGTPTDRPKLVGHQHVGPVNDLAFSLDNGWLGSTSADPIAILHRLDPAQGEPPGIVFKDRTDVAYTSIAIKPDQRAVAIGHSDGVVRVFDPRQALSGERPQALQFSLHDGHEVTALAFRNGRLYSSGRDGRLVSVDAENVADTPLVIARQTDWIRDFTVTPNGQVVFTACKDGSLGLWDGQNPRLLRVVQAHLGGTDAIAYSRIGGVLATGGRDNAVRLWDARGLLDGTQTEPIATYLSHTKPVLALAFNPTGSLLLSGGGDNVIRLWAAQK
ncbi:MAG: hypothetical protein MUC99_08745 [Anaerolineae bacterium]|jgi:WD40 repeat protein|nr:hypothetical protein [Anaerolineae bacterium]